MNKDIRFKTYTDKNNNTTIGLVILTIALVLFTLYVCNVIGCTNTTCF